MSHFSPIIAVLVTIFINMVILSSKFGSQIQDIPNERSLHEKPIPRIGGIGLIGGVLSGWALIMTSLLWWLVLPLLGLFVVSLFDDIHGMSVRKRLLAHLGAAGVLVIGSGFLSQQGMVFALVVLLLTVWMTNLFNFMDGSDGLAGGMALFGFFTYSIAAWLAGNNLLALVCMSIVASSGAFLLYNFHPARIFMGDAGSIPLGFLAAAIGLWGQQLGVWPLWFPLLVFSPFIVDATVTLMKRLLRRERVWLAHRSHYYQRLVQMGWGHRKTALWEYGLMISVGGTAVWLIEQSLLVQFLGLVGWLLVYAMLLLMVDHVIRVRAL